MPSPPRAHPEATLPRSWLGSVAARAPIATFLVGTFGWAWLLWAYWVPTMPPGSIAVSVPFLLCAIGGGFAPSLAAIAVAWLRGGRAEVARLLAPLGAWRQPVGLYALALLLVPATAAVSALAQAAFMGPLVWPEPGLVAMAVVWPLLAAIGEEIGWRAFLQPRLAQRVGVLAAALVIGIIWGVWHLPADYIGLKAYGDWFVPAFLVNGPIVLTAHAIILAGLWTRTRSPPLAVLYHASITASAILMPTAGAAGPSGVLAAAIGAALLWLVAGWLVVARRDDFRLTPAA